MNFSNDYCIHIIKVEKLNFQFLYMYLHFIFKFLNCFAVFVLKIRRELSDLLGTEMLFIDMFGPNVQQPLQ